MPRTPRPVTFTCSWCYREVTEDRKPGPMPQYCQGCAVEAKRSAEAGAFSCPRPAWPCLCCRALVGDKERGTIMTNSEPDAGEAEPVQKAGQITIPTWRYIGTRAAADAAYRARFGATAVPEPIPMSGGIWAYALPSPS